MITQNEIDEERLDEVLEELKETGKTYVTSKDITVDMTAPRKGLALKQLAERGDIELFAERNDANLYAL